MPPPVLAAAASGIAYRPMAQGDMPFLASLYASGREAELAVTGWPPEAKRSFLLQQFDAQHRHYMAHYAGAEWLVIERAGVPIGRLYLVDWGKEIRIIDITLDPSVQREGIGTAILRDVLGSAAAGSKCVSIHVEKANPARHLYGRLGFVVAGEHGVYDLMEWRCETQN